MKTLLFAISLTAALTAIAQEKDKIHFWLGPKATLISHQGLQNFNEVISANGVKEIAESTVTGGALLFTQIGKFDFGLDLAAVNLNNKVKPPETQVIFSYISGDFNAGFNFFGINQNTRLSPFAGIGLQFTQVYVISHDSTITINETLQGAQNMNYQRPALGITAHAGMRFCKFIDGPRQFGFFGEFIYNTRLNGYNWKIPDMPVDRLSGISFSAGILFRLND